MTDTVQNQSALRPDSTAHVQEESPSSEAAGSSPEADVYPEHGGTPKPRNNPRAAPVRAAIVHEDFGHSLSPKVGPEPSTAWIGPRGGRSGKATGRKEPCG